MSSVPEGNNERAQVSDTSPTFNMTELGNITMKALEEDSITKESSALQEQSDSEQNTQDLITKALCAKSGPSEAGRNIPSPYTRDTNEPSHPGAAASHQVTQLQHENQPEQPEILKREPNSLAQNKTEGEGKNENEMPATDAQEASAAKILERETVQKLDLEAPVMDTAGQSEPTEHEEQSEEENQQLEIQEQYEEERSAGEVNDYEELRAIIETVGCNNIEGPGLDGTGQSATAKDKGGQTEEEKKQSEIKEQYEEEKSAGEVTDYEEPTTVVKTVGCNEMERPGLDGTGQSATAVDKSGQTEEENQQSEIQKQYEEARSAREVTDYEELRAIIETVGCNNIERPGLDGTGQSATAMDKGGQTEEEAIPPSDKELPATKTIGGFVVEKGDTCTDVSAKDKRHQAKTTMEETSKIQCEVNKDYVQYEPNRVSTEKQSEPEPRPTEPIKPFDEERHAEADNLRPRRTKKADNLLHVETVGSSVTKRQDHQRDTEDQSAAHAGVSSRRNIRTTGAAAVLGILLIVALRCLTTTSDMEKPTYSVLQVFQREFETLRRDFPGQNEALWLRSRKMLQKHLNNSHPLEPATLILTAARDAETTLRCLSERLARAYSTSVNATQVVIDGPSKAARDSKVTKLEIDIALSSAFEDTSRAAVLHRLETLPADCLLILYKYCDHENAAFKNVALVLTVLLDDPTLESFHTLTELEEKVRDFLWDTFTTPNTMANHNEMNRDKLSGVWSRISHLVLPVLPVDVVETNDCK